MTGKEISVQPIKLKNHRSNVVLDAELRELQKLLYFYAGKEIIYTARADIMTKMTEIGKNIVEIECDESAKPRKEEILLAMRTIFKSVKTYLVKPLTKDDLDKIQKVCNYCIAKSIKVKEGSEEDILKQMYENKKVYNIYARPFLEAKLGVTLHIGNFMKIQQELLQIIGKKYGLENYD